MEFNPRGLLVTAAFAGAFYLALDYHLGLTTSLVAGAAYTAVELIGTGFARFPRPEGQRLALAGQPLERGLRWRRAAHRR